MNLTRLIRCMTGVCLAGVIGLAAAPAVAQRGACCFARTNDDGVVVASSCLQLSRADCARRGGEWQGRDTSCRTRPCPEPVVIGACCLTTSTDERICQILERDACREAGGRFAGRGSECTPETCAPRGACCLPPREDGRFAGVSVCVITTQSRCAENNGTWTRGERCSGTTCPQPVGACCVRNAGAVTCVSVSRVECSRINGRFKGLDASCDDPDVCAPPPPRGACCFENVCSITTEADCAGTWTEGEPCAGSGCSPCPCDIDSNGELDTRDLMRFLRAYFAGDADFDGDGETDQSDLQAYVDCYSTPDPLCVND